MPARKKATRKSATRKKVARPAARKNAARKKTAVRKPAARPKRPTRSSTPSPRPAAPAAIPSAIGMSVHHFDFTTHDIDAVKRFYVDLLGFSSHEHDPQFNYLWVQTGGSSSLGFMPPMQGMGETSPPKEPTLYFIVEDVDRAYATLSARGVMFEGPPADMPWGHRVVRTLDPEGRPVMLATRRQS